MSVVPASQQLANYTQDVVGIFDPKSGAQLFTNARTMKANVNRNSKIMDHPLETGQPVSDYKIILPVEIELGVLVDSTDSESIYDAMVAAFLSSQPLTVRTNATSYSNIVVAGMPHDESPDMWGMLVIGLKLREAQLVTVQFQDLPAANVATATDQSTVNTGEQTAPAVTGGSALYSAYAAMFAPPKVGQ